MGQNQLTFFVFLIFYINLNGIAYLQVWIVAEFGCGDNTIALETDAYDNLFLVDRDYFSFYNLMIGDLIKGFVVSLLQVFLADVYACTFLKLVPIEVV